MLQQKSTACFETPWRVQRNIRQSIEYYGCHIPKHSTTREEFKAKYTHPCNWGCDKWPTFTSPTNSTILALISQVKFTISKVCKYNKRNRWVICITVLLLSCAVVQVLLDCDKGSRRKHWGEPLNIPGLEPLPNSLFKAIFNFLCVSGHVQQFIYLFWWDQSERLDNWGCHIVEWEIWRCFCGTVLPVRSGW